LKILTKRNERKNETKQYLEKRENFHKNTKQVNPKRVKKTRGSKLGFYDTDSSQENIEKERIVIIIKMAALMIHWTHLCAWCAKNMVVTTSNGSWSHVECAGWNTAEVE
jgi:hypothetical protein